MANGFDRFSRGARQSLSMAQEEARRLNHRYIGTEHLLLGLMREEKGEAARILSEMGLSIGQLRDAVERMVGTGDRAPASLQLGEQTKKVIQLAIDESKRRGHEQIGTEHLLGCRDHRSQHRHEVERSRQRARDGEDRVEVPRR